MIELMDKAMLALQAAATGRKLYGAEHPVPRRQIELAVDTLGQLLGAAPELKVVRLDNALMFLDAELPSCPMLAAWLLPRLTLHGIEWVEFRKGLTQPEVVQFLDQLDRPSTEGGKGQSDTAHVRLGRIGRPNANHEAASAMMSALDRDEQVGQLKSIWSGLRGGGDRPDQRLGDLVESIRLAVSVGADVCNQLAEVKSHDEYTFVHTVNVAILSAALAEAVGMSQNQVFELILAALLHDVGKQRTPLEILNKPGILDAIERKRMEQHTVDGAAILLSRRGVPDVAPIVAYEHHANVDGTGYPGRIPGGPHLASQIVHVADVFDALRTNRPYRAALEESKVRNILMEGAGKSFDPALVDLFLERVVKLSTPRGGNAAREGGTPNGGLARALAAGGRRLSA
jgi:putative nucleotidyltransferase with HDIG domain